MMDELKQQFYEVMHKYQKPFSEEGVTANLTQWYEQKQGLLQLLRRHPLWNEKELAIVFRVEERREIDRATVDETRAAILELGRRACTDDTVYENFETALRASTADYARIPNEYRLDTIRQYGDIKCAPGQKASRIINRLCLKFHLDQIEEEAEAGEPDNRYMRTVKPYNALFARLADALNPAHIEKTAVLSIHPCDFLEMSNRDNTWSSCHCLEGGGYRGGCQSYMGDAVSMIFFTVSDEYTQDFHTAPRITREIFCYKDNVLLQSRLYPTDLEDQKTLYRSIVQQAIATCLDKPNLWSLKRGKDTEPYCESAADSNHYPDYKYGYAVASLLKGENDYGQMTIGSVARCVCCGGEQKNHRSIRCAECGNMYVCKGCGKTVHGYGRYIDEHFYCNECSYECAVCKEKFIGMPRIGIARSGEQRGIWGYYVTVKLSTPQTVDGTAIHYLTFAHNARNLVSDGDTVTTGTPLAIAGKTGNAEGEHIHCHLQARNVNNSGAYNPVGFSGIRNEKGEYNIKTSGSMQKIELGPVLNSQASAIWNKAKALGVTYAAFYADPDNSRQIIQLGPVSNSMASTLYSYAVNEMKVSYRSWYI